VTEPDHLSDPAELSHEVLVRVADFLRRLPPGQLVDLAEGNAKLELVPKAARGPRTPLPVRLPLPAAEIGATLAEAPDRATAVAYLDGLKLTVPQFRALARALDIAVPSRATRAQTRDTLVHWTVGRRVDSLNLRRSSPRRDFP
jgi:hypothetical protein